MGWHYGPKLLSGERLLLLGGDTVRYHWRGADGVRVLRHASWHLTKMLMGARAQLDEICAFPDDISVAFCGGAGGLRALPPAERAARVARVAAATAACEDVYGAARVPMRPRNVSAMADAPRQLDAVLRRWAARARREEGAAGGDDDAAT